MRAIIVRLPREVRPACGVGHNIVPRTSVSGEGSGGVDSLFRLSANVNRRSRSAFVHVRILAEGSDVALRVPSMTRSRSTFAGGTWKVDNKGWINYAQCRSHVIVSVAYLKDFFTL